MAYWDGIDLTSPASVEFATGAGVAIGGGIGVGSGIEIELPTVEPATGLGLWWNGVFLGVGQGLDIASHGIEFATTVGAAVGLCVEAGSGRETYAWTLAVVPGDNAILVSIGFVCDFEASTRSAAAFSAIQFWDRTQGPDITGWRWSFGDGHVSYKQNPRHTYLFPGIYTVTLRVFAGGEQRDSCVKTGFVFVFDGADIRSRHYWALRRLMPSWLGSAVDRVLRVIGAQLDKLISDFASESEWDDDALKQVFVDTATANVGDWERVYAIGQVGDSLEDRRAELASARAAVLGGLSIPYFYSVAEKLGYVCGTAVGFPHLRIDCSRFFPFRAGISKAGIDAVYDLDYGSSVWTWSVFGSFVESDVVLQSRFSKLKPAHTDVLFVNE